MKLSKPGTVVLLVIACALASGCVAGRRTIALEVPKTEVAAAAKGTVGIGAVKDARHFENKPAEASTPSIDGDVNAVPRDSLKIMIGRQRGGFGNALGDVALAGGATVETETRTLISEGLRRRGYGVSEGTAADNAVEVTIDEFWAWFRPGFAEIAFEAQIKTQIAWSVAGQTHNLTVLGHGREEGQIASDEHWQAAYTLAYEDYLKNLEAALAEAGL